MGKKLRRTRLIAIALCVIFVAALLLAANVFAHRNHIHDRNGPNGACAACAQITAAVNTLKYAGAAVVCAAICVSAFFAILSCLKPSRKRTGSITLIDLKVQLNY